MLLRGMAHPDSTVLSYPFSQDKLENLETFY